MAKKASKKSSDKTLRLTAEEMYGEEIDALIKADKGDCPTGWKMSPKSVLTYICGGKCGKLDIQPKYCLLYTSPSPRDLSTSRMPSSA